MELTSSTVPTLCEDKDIIKEKEMNDEYKIWKKNNPLLYDLIITHALEWPTLTVQWLPDIERPSGSDYTIQRILMGTHTSNNEPNYLRIMQVKLPIINPDEELYNDDSGDDSKDNGNYGGVESKIGVVQKINHDGEVNRARYMPSNPDMFATRTVKGPVYIFDRIRHPSTPDPNTGCNPDIRLIGHTKEGYGTSWHPKREGILLTSSDDTTICEWDILGCTKENRTLGPKSVYTSHTSSAEDVAWSWLLDPLFASVGDDGMFKVWDRRSKTKDSPAQSIHLGEVELNCVTFSPMNENIVATGDNHGKISLWDMRNLKTSLHDLEKHSGEILQLLFSPSNETIIASSSSDRTVCIWDLSKIGSMNSPEELEEGPPELIFVHKGHTSKVVDFSWSPNDPWVICSATEDNICQIWQMTNTIYSFPESVPYDELE